MYIELFLCLLFAHLVADFVLQTNKICKNKLEKKWCSCWHYVHAIVVFSLSWLVIFDKEFWLCAFIIGISHFFIDMWKSYKAEDVFAFVLDQIMHLAVIAGISYYWFSISNWSVPFDINFEWIAMAVAVVVCWKPSNIFIKLMLKHYSLSMSDEKASGFSAGALIGTLERWLILIFVLLQRYDALGLLIAAKSIIRFSEKDTAKTEYVLAGTLLSIFIAIIAGLVVLKVLDYSF